MGDWPHVRCNRAQAGTRGRWSASNLLHWLILRMTLYSRLSVVHYNIYYTCTEYLTQVIFSQCKQPHCKTLSCRLNIQRHFWSRPVWLIDKTKGSNNDDPNWVFVAFHTDHPPILFLLCFILKHFCRASFSAQSAHNKYNINWEREEKNQVLAIFFSLPLLFFVLLVTFFPVLFQTRVITV